MILFYAGNAGSNKSLYINLSKVNFLALQTPSLRNASSIADREVFDRVLGNVIILLGNASSRADGEVFC